MDRHCIHKGFPAIELTIAGNHVQELKLVTLEVAQAVTIQSLFAVLMQTEIRFETVTKVFFCQLKVRKK